MYSPRVQAGCFVLEGVNSLGTTYYFYYLYFFTEKQFGFTKLENLVLAAAMGLVYTVSSVWGGTLAQRRGYFTALKCGYAVMAVSMAAGAFIHVLPISLALMFAAYCGAAMTWPALEALVSEGNSRRRLQRNLGIYNFVWAGFGAIAYFSGGAMIKAWSFQVMFLVPAGLSALQLPLAIWLERMARSTTDAATSVQQAERDERMPAEAERVRSVVPPATFLKMAWLANPFGYLTINTIVAVVPTLAHRFELSVMWAGIFGSVWLFVRTISFLILWAWPGWHYRFGWLLGGYVLLTVSFVTVLLSPNLWLAVVAQAGLGLALGLVYYSSLYYSMDVGDRKGEHGGFHEAMIGAGSCAGPAVGALGLHLFPQSSNISTWMPAGLMVIGFAGLMWLRFWPRSGRR